MRIAPHHSDPAARDFQSSIPVEALLLTHPSHITLIRGDSTPPMQETADTSGRDEKQEREKEPLVVIPYVAGMSEDIRRVCRKFNIRVVCPGGLSVQC